MRRTLTAAAVLSLVASSAAAQIDVDRGRQPNTSNADANEVTLADVQRELAAQRELIEEQRRQLEAQQQQLDEGMAASDGVDEADLLIDELVATADDEYTEEDVLRVYGFLDVGWQRFFAGPDSFFYGVTTSNENSFILGNFNLFFDAKAGEDWRALAEVRFTTLPHGVETAYGVPALGVDYNRIDSETFDITSSTGRVNVILGSIIMERAWIEYEYRDWLRIRAGSFFTPVGIWNIDHATPTLIALNLPNVIAAELFPLRQLGLQFHGVLHAEPLELGYHLTVSNGRTPGQFDLTDDKAVGGRLFVRTEDGASGWAAGVSGYYGTFGDETKNITSFDPFRISPVTTVKGTEGAIGLDFSLDYSGLRWRTEGVAQRVDYEEGFHEPAFGAPGWFAPNRWNLSGYTLVAYRFGGIPIEPYVFFEMSHGPQDIGDTTFGYSAGLNIYFMEEVQLMMQATRFLFRNLSLPPNPDSEANDFGFIAMRLVMAF